MQIKYVNQLSKLELLTNNIYVYKYLNLNKIIMSFYRHKNNFGVGTTKIYLIISVYINRLNNKLLKEKTYFNI